MPQITVAPNFESWQRAARSLLQQNIPPDETHWLELEGDQPSLDLFDELEPSAPKAAAVFRVPKEFLSVGKRVAMNSDPRRWGLLYRVVWRLTHGESKLLEIASDPTIVKLGHLEKEVRHEIHKMRAFVRFRQVHEFAEEPWYVAWFEPEHHTVEANAPFFTDRFANMCWSILTPDRCLHWNREELTVTAGVPKSEAPTEDATEALWLRYYSSIFNPARVKTRAMQKEMPKRYWKNLPEAAVISTLLQEAPARVEAMIAKSDAKKTGDVEWRPAEPPATSSLRILASAAAGCTACPLYKNATQTVFGEGPRNAEIVIVGEQPGDQEDLAGHPFVGPAGQLLNRAMEEAGIDRSKVYVTNVVKHFKWEPRGKRRLHQTPNSRDIAACRPWLEAEIGLLKPRLLVCLGATAAKTIFGPAMRVTKSRGQFLESAYCRRTLVTVHPSSLLRAPTPEERETNYGLFVNDLRLIPKSE